MATESKALSQVSYTVMHSLLPRPSYTLPAVDRGTWYNFHHHSQPEVWWTSTGTGTNARRSIFMSYHGDDSAMPARIVEVMAEIEDLEDDWDGRGALAPTNPSSVRSGGW